MANNRVIGNKNSLPWSLPEDLKYFKEKTINSVVLMGNNTYLSIPENFRPLSQRFNIVVTKSKDKVNISHVHYLNNLEKFIYSFKLAGFKKFNFLNENYAKTDVLWVIGGESIYKQFLSLADEIFLTKINLSPSGDSFFPEFETNFNLINTDHRLAGKGSLEYSHNHYIRALSSAG